jgi:hypothetical protein
VERCDMASDLALGCAPPTSKKIRQNQGNRDRKGWTYSNQFRQRISGSASSGVSLKIRQARAHELRTARKSSLPAGKAMAPRPLSISVSGVCVVILLPEY